MCLDCPMVEPKGAVLETEVISGTADGGGSGRITKPWSSRRRLLRTRSSGRSPVAGGLIMRPKQVFTWLRQARQPTASEPASETPPHPRTKHLASIQDIPVFRYDNERKTSFPFNSHEEIIPSSFKIVLEGVSVR